MRLHSNWGRRPSDRQKRRRSKRNRRQLAGQMRSLGAKYRMSPRKVRRISFRSMNTWGSKAGHRRKQSIGARKRLSVAYWGRPRSKRSPSTCGERTPNAWKRRLAERMMRGATRSDRRSRAAHGGGVQSPLETGVRRRRMRSQLGSASAVTPQLSTALCPERDAARTWRSLWPWSGRRAKILPCKPRHHSANHACPWQQSWNLCQHRERARRGGEVVKAPKARRRKTARAQGS
mmetsp:Transcript_26236/g.83048  ORF Transcript_26236/g.83048 Transcript_26236/m.83048 type:complete len:233 (+) Transcript_26236:1416-2114(+)